MEGYLSLWPKRQDPLSIAALPDSSSPLAWNITAAHQSNLQIP
jgi:hypothetical protein